MWRTLWLNWLLYLAWPAFMSACLLELMIFAVVDPHDLSWFQEVNVTRQTVYTVAFFVFWIVSMLPGALALFLARESDAFRPAAHEDYQSIMESPHD